MNANGYFRKLDPQIKEMAGFPIPPDWWSRGYEYAWAIAQARPGEMVMDAGCGFGHPLKYELAKVSKRVFAVDVSPGVLELTEREGVEYICADMADTGLPAESMDTIYCISVLEHLKKEELWDVWQEFIRLLKPGGRVVITLDVLFDPGKGPKHSWVEGPAQFLATLPEKLGIEAPAPVNMPDDAVSNRPLNLAVYKLILRKAGD